MERSKGANAATSCSDLFSDHAEQFLLRLTADRFPGCAYIAVKHLRGMLGQADSVGSEPARD